MLDEVRFRGHASVHRAGPEFEAGLRFHQLRSGLEASRIDAIVLVRIDAAIPVVSSAYDDGTSEQEVERRSLALYHLARSHDS